MRKFEMKLLVTAIICLFILSSNVFSQADVWYAKGQQSLQKKDYDKAIEFFTRAIEIDRGSHKYFDKRGLAYLFHERSAEAIEDFSTSLQIDSNNADAYNNRGLAFGLQGDLDRALSDFNKAISLDQNFGQAYLNRGSIYIQFKNNDSAMNDFTRAIKLEPQNPEIFYNRARLNYTMDNYQKAIDDFSEAIKLGINIGKIYYNRGNAYFKLEKYTLAINDYTKALGFDKNDVEALNNRAMAYDKSGNKKKAEQDRKTLSKLSGEVPRFLPVDSLEFKTYTDKEERFWIDLPASWHSQTFTDKEITELVVAQEDPNKGPFAVGVRLVFNKTMKEKYDTQGIAELIAFWEGSNQKNADEYYDYRIYSKKTMARGDYRGSLNLVHVKVTSESYFMQLYELVLASENNLFFAYFQCPQVQFDYYKQIFDKAISSFKIK